VGILAVWAYGQNQTQDSAVNQLMQEYYAETVGPYWPPECRRSLKLTRLRSK